MRYTEFKAITKKYLGLSIAASMVLSSIPLTTHAGLKDALNQMFVSTSTSPQAISTQRLMGMYGGSMSIRPISPGINIVQFAAPRIDAGCGGIDLFFGSFSFINGAQFEQLIRSIAANAVGFAIKAAIKSMCNPCSELLDVLQAEMSKLNAMAKNTCALSQQLMTSDGRAALMNNMSEMGKNLSTAFGKVADHFKGENNRASETPKETATGKGPGGATTAASAAIADNNPMNGNVVYRAAKQTLNNGGNPLRAFLSEADTIRIVMGLYGTVVFNQDSKTTCPAGTPAEKCGQPPDQTDATITRWEELMEPKKNFQAGKGVPVLQCGGSECLDVTTVELPLSSWGGVSEYINMALFGVEDGPVSEQFTTPDSIVGMFYHKASDAQLNAKARGLIQMVPFPILRMMQEVQGVPNAGMTLAFQLAEILPQYFSYYLASNLQNIGENVFSKQSAVDMPQKYKDNLAKKMTQLNGMKPNGDQLLKLFNESTRSVINIKTLTRTQYKLQVNGK